MGRHYGIIKVRISNRSMKLEILTENKTMGVLDTRFVLVTTLESLKNEKGQQYLDFWLSWENYFHKIQLPVWILTKDTPKESAWFHQVYSTQLHIGCCQGTQNFSKLGCLKNKSVFGKSYPIIDPAIFLFHRNQIVYKAYRTNNKSIGEAYLKGFDVQYKKFVINFRKKLTDQREFDSIRKR